MPVDYSWTIPSNLSPGNYKVCAMIDPDDEFSETKEIDNSVGSENDFVIQ